MSIPLVFRICLQLYLTLPSLLLGASIENIADNVGRQSTDVASIYVARGAGSIVGSFASAPMFDSLNAIQSIFYAYVVTAGVMVWIAYIDSLVSLHIAYFMIGGLTSLISAGSILLLRKIHKEHAGPWLGALGFVHCCSAFFIHMLASIRCKLCPYTHYLYLLLF